MDSNNILKKGIQVVTFLFAAFNGFLLNIAPPEEVETRFAVGMGSLIALFSLLLISSIIKTRVIKSVKKLWIIISLCFFIIMVISVYYYKLNMVQLTFSYPPENPKTYYITGLEMTTEAKQYSEKFSPGKSVSELVADFEGPQFKERVWTKESIEKAKMRLTINYLIVILSTSIMIFSLTEGILTVKKDK
jgi:hypothetical protein